METWRNLPAHIHRPGAPQRGVWVRMNLGARREGSMTGPNSLTFRDCPVGMVVDAPGDVAALCRFMIFYTGGNVTGKLNGLAETDLRVLIGGRAVEGDRQLRC